MPFSVYGCLCGMNSFNDSTNCASRVAHFQLFASAFVLTGISCF